MGDRFSSLRDGGRGGGLGPRGFVGRGLRGKVLLPSNILYDCPQSPHFQLLLLPCRRRFSCRSWRYHPYYPKHPPLVSQPLPSPPPRPAPAAVSSSSETQPSHPPPHPHPHPTPPTTQTPKPPHSPKSHPTPPPPTTYVSNTPISTAGTVTLIPFWGEGGAG